MIFTIQKRKCHAVPYINGRLWDPAADSYTALNGASASCRKADGTLYTEIYPTSKVLNTVTCPASSLWHEIIIGLADKIQTNCIRTGCISIRLRLRLLSLVLRRITDMPQVAEIFGINRIKL